MTYKRMVKEIKAYQNCVSKINSRVLNLLARMHYDGSNAMMVTEAELLSLLPEVFNERGEPIE